MVIQTYFDQIKKVLNRFATTHFVIEVKIHLDIRPGEQGYIKGTIHFIDHSTLHFIEFLDAFKDIVDKLKYSYHYQDKTNKLIFRYDDAVHKPILPFREHKHLPEEILESPAPTLSDVIVEIFTIKEWI